jgi:hypothetical protein
MKIIFAFMIALMIAHNVIILRIAKRLEKMHREVWISLGQPSFFNNSILNGMKLVSYVIFGRHYNLLGDNRLSYLIRVNRAVFIFAMFFFVIFMSYVLLQISGRRY